jgi:hypothetical protein
MSQIDFIRFSLLLALPSEPRLNTSNEKDGSPAANPGHAISATPSAALEN